jgi:hypothetical protein
MVSCGASVVSENDVGWIDLEDGMKQMSSDTYVEVHLNVPGWFPFSVAATEKTGTFLSVYNNFDILVL